MTTMNTTMMNIDPVRLITRKGFINAYWEVIRALTAKGDRFTNKEVFENLNEKRRKTYGELSFPSYNAFVMYLKRRN